MATAGEGRGKRPAMIIRAVIAVILSGWLCWQIGAMSIAALAARSLHPRLLAVFGTPAHPQAGARLAQQLLAGGQTAPAADLARAVVIADPTDDRALRVLGLATEKLGERERGAAIMRQAAALGWRDTPTQLWVLHDAAVRDDPVTVIQRADGLARRNRSGELTRAVFLAAITEPGLRAAFIDSLARQPMWRGAFFSDVRQYLPATSAPAMEALFRKMRAKGLAISAVEQLSYVARLIDLAEFERARAFWAQAFAIPAPALAATPYDGNFTVAGSRPGDAPISPFEWMVNPDLAGTVTFGNKGLSVPADLIGGTTIASQVLVLPPGDHLLTAGIDGQASAASAGWTLTCLPSNLELRRRLAGGAEDELSSVAFTVPDDGCAGQRLTLLSRDRLGAQAVTIGNVRVR